MDLISDRMILQCSPHMQTFNFPSQFADKALQNIFLFAIYYSNLAGDFENQAKVVWGLSESFWSKFFKTPIHMSNIF